MRIDFKNYNDVTVTGSYRIYRSYRPIDPNNPWAPIAEVPVGTPEWYDLTVDLQRIAYYRISIVSDGNEVIGPEYCTTKRFYSGPEITDDAPDMVIRGNAEYGYYGKIAQERVLPIDQLVDKYTDINLIPGTDITDIYYEKCLYKGNVLFIPSKPFVQGSFSDLWRAGIAYSNPNAKNYLTPEFAQNFSDIPQSTTITMGVHTYKVRAMNEEEFRTIYPRLYPTSGLGQTVNTILANSTPHTHGLIIPRTQEQGEQVYAYTINNAAELVDRNAVRPILLILELVSRNDIIAPTPTVEHLTDFSYPNHMPTIGIYKNRLHVLGGFAGNPTSTSEATKTHMSFALDGTDAKVHPDLSFGIGRGHIHVHDGKMFVFPIYDKFDGAISGTFIDVNNHDFVHVYTEDVSGVGSWVAFPPPSPEFRLAMASVGMYPDIATGEMHFVMTSGLSPMANKLHFARVDSFNNRWEARDIQPIVYSKGAALHVHEDTLYSIGGIHSNGMPASKYANLVKLKPLAPMMPFDDVPVRRDTKMSELDYSNSGYAMSWKDTVYYVNGRLFPSATTDCIYQYIELETRWVRIPIDLGPTGYRRELASVSQGNVIYIVRSKGNTDNEDRPITLHRVTLLDPDQAPLLPITGVNKANIVNRPWRVRLFA